MSICCLVTILDISIICVDNGSYYKNEDQQVGSSIVDSETGGLVAISGGRNYRDIQDRNQATDATKPPVSLSTIEEPTCWSSFL